MNKKYLAKIIATDNEGLQMISACTAGAKIKVSDKVKSKNIDQKNDDLVLELVAIDYLKNGEEYEISLIFDSHAHISLTTETIEVILEDQN